MAFRKTVPYNIQEAGLGATWTKVLDNGGVGKLGDLQASTGQRVDLAFSASPPAIEIVTLGEEPREFYLPPYKDLYARAEGGGSGPAELHGTLWAE